MKETSKDIQERINATQETILGLEKSIIEMEDRKRKARRNENAN